MKQPIGTVMTVGVLTLAQGLKGHRFLTDQGEVVEVTGNCNLSTGQLEVKVVPAK